MLINTFRRVRGCKINTQNVVEFLQANDKYSKKEKNPIYDPLKKIKNQSNQGIQKLTQWKPKDTEERSWRLSEEGKISQALGLVRLML